MQILQWVTVKFQRPFSKEFIPLECENLVEEVMIHTAPSSNRCGERPRATNMCCNFTGFTYWALEGWNLIGHVLLCQLQAEMGCLEHRKLLHLCHTVPVFFFFFILFDVALFRTHMCHFCPSKPVHFRHYTMHFLLKDGLSIQKVKSHSNSSVQMSH